MLFRCPNWAEHTLQSRLLFLYAILIRDGVCSLRQSAPHAVNMHERAGRKMFHIRSLPPELSAASQRGAGDNSHCADARLMVVRLHRRATEGTAVRTSKDLRVEREFCPTWPCRPCQYLANPEGLHAAAAVCRLLRHRMRLRGRAKHEVLVDAALTEEVPPADMSGGSERQATASSKSVGWLYRSPPTARDIRARSSRS